MQRGVMMNMFTHDRMDYISDVIEEVVKRNVKTLIEKENIVKNKKITIDFTKYVDNMMFEILNLLVYGYRHDEEWPTVGGKPIIVANDERRVMTIRVRKNL